jgi:hypothetical protein
MRKQQILDLIIEWFDNIKSGVDNLEKASVNYKQNLKKYIDSALSMGA